MACPFCTRGFTTATGVAHHIEAGACPNAPNINRDALYELIRAKDPYGLITKKLIGWMGSATYEVTNKTWNGSGYECYFCPRSFRTLHGLNQHTNSPIREYSNGGFPLMAPADNCTTQINRSCTTAPTVAAAARTLSVWVLSSTIWRARPAVSPGFIKCRANLAPSSTQAAGSHFGLELDCAHG